MNHLRALASVCILLIIISCGKSSSSNAQPSTITKAYKESNEDFPNPERGFYRYSQTLASSYSPLSLEELKEWRQLKKADGSANYSIYSTLVFRYFILDAFTSSPISQEFLTNISVDFERARQAGVKLIPRFTYTTTAKSGNCPEGFICPPYGDAAKNIVLQHIAQLKPVLTANADVIAVLQVGFIGTWGEQYYTDYFGDASQNAQGKLLDQNWTDRTEVVKALLDAIPSDRMVQVRYPQLKQRVVYGIQANVSSAPLTEAEAYTSIDKARIGFHNDCFLASADDYGTYEDYGNSSSARTSALQILKPYFQQDSKYVAVGGETCDDAFSPQNDCAPAGRADIEMRELHYSYLNCAYNNQVNNDWQTGGCMESIKKNLGYRFVIDNIIYSPSSPAGSKIDFIFNIRNAGYAAPFNPRPAKLLFRKNDKQYSFDLDTDVRKWFSGNIKLEQSVNLPSDMEKGSYELYLYFPDKYSSISERPEYAIRLANDNMWDNTTGFNKLNISIEVK